VAHWPAEEKGERLDGAVLFEGVNPFRQFGGGEPFPALVEGDPAGPPAAVEQLPATVLFPEVADLEIAAPRESRPVFVDGGGGVPQPGLADGEDAVFRGRRSLISRNSGKLRTDRRCRVERRRRGPPAASRLFIRLSGWRRMVLRIHRSLSPNHAASSGMGRRSCCIESRSRTVTVSFREGPFSPRVSKSTVKQNGVPISSWRR